MVVMKRYNPLEIEQKWQQKWATDKRYIAPNQSEKPKYYVSGMFPYPSGAGMHTGHFFEHSIVDSVARFRRALGYNVMYPMGWDSFGLPAENYAIKTGKTPQETTATNIANFKNQLTRVGASIDWTREINTTDPDYYKWTQWIFTQLFDRGLAYQKEAMQWWCPKDKTVLANEQVIDGRCWRCESIVEKKAMKQWFFKITDYADALLEEIPGLNWPDKIKLAQTNWIGRSEGAEVEFKVDGKQDIITVFTTRPDTLFGATFLVLAPEHALVASLVNDETKDTVTAYIDQAVKKSEIERQSEGKEKTGVFTGSYAINPVNGAKIPIWIADYVLSGYGTGAIMAVPAHDERDYEFAKKFDLPIVSVVAQDFGEPLTGAKQVEGVVVIGYDPATDKYLSLNHEGRTRLVSGGREEGESFEEVAYRELSEEAGYAAVDAMIPLGAPVYSYYTNPMKGDRRSLGYNYLAIIDSTQKVDQHLESHEKFTPQWQSYEDLFAAVQSYPGGVAHWLEGLERARSAAEAYKNGDAYEAELYHGEGLLINSGQFNTMPTAEAREEIVAWLEQQGVGRAKVTYKMRDWLISRQRYWGAPIPIIHCDTCGAVPVPKEDLPVLLPDVEDFAPRGDGKSVLAAQEDWVNVTCPTCGGKAKRETDTMDGYACSSWYLLRYADPQDDAKAWDPELVNYWAPLDIYIGGDHAVAHLLYVRFWTHVFKDMGLTDFKEPVYQLVYHGLIQAEDGRKMSKSLGNVVDPLEVIDQGYGADALRTFELFLGPINENSNWSSRGITGVYRFLNRVWTLAQEYMEAGEQPGANQQLDTLTHAVIKKVTDDYERLNFNTAIAAMMEYTNELYKLKTDGFTGDWRFAVESITKLLQPLAPHMAAELWEQLGHTDQLDFVSWPQWDDAKIVNDMMTIVVQVNGKVRAKLNVAAGTSDTDIKATALADENVKKHIGAAAPSKVIYISGKLVSIVVAA